MLHKLFGLSALLLTAIPLQADCRRAVVVQRNVVAVEAAFVAVPVPLFATAYAAGYSYAPQVAPTASTKSDMQLFIEEIRALRAEMKAMREGKVAPEVQAQAKLGFLSDATGCAQCHNGANAKGKLDLSKGLEGLTARQLALITLRTNMDKDNPKVMPPKDAKMAAVRAHTKEDGTLTDERYNDLAAGVMAQLEGQK